MRKLPKMIPRKPKTFLFTIGFWLLSLGFFHSIRGDLTQFITVFNLPDWQWNELTPLFTGSLLTLFCVGVYRIAASKEREADSKLDVMIGRIEEVLATLEQVVVELKIRDIAPLEPLPELPEET